MSVLQKQRIFKKETRIIQTDKTLHHRPDELC